MNVRHSNLSKVFALEQRSFLSADTGIFTRDIHRWTPRPGRYTLHALFDIDEDLLSVGFGDGTASEVLRGKDREHQLDRNARFRLS